jgi:hypothetical protein
MKYTEENLRHVLKKLSPTIYEPLYKNGYYLPEIIRLISLDMFRKMLWGVVIQKEDAIILRQAIDNLDNKGMFNFEE